MLKRALLATALCLVAATPALAAKGGALPWSQDLDKAPTQAKDLGQGQVYYFTKDG